MQPTPPSNRTRPDSLPEGTKASSYATILLIRRILYLLSYIGGAATGWSLMTLVLYQPTDWRWGGVGVCGVLAGALAARLIRYFPQPTRRET